jgi:DMSO/TMAO reductase YedYZ molybdopterin-dependent catalytic subunit
MTIDGTPEAVGAAGEDLAARVRATPLTALEQGGIAGHFVRDHFGAPEVELAGWRLAVEGAVRCPGSLTLDDLRALPRVARTVVLECAGHRRAEHQPPVEGVAWEVGAVAEARWAGTALASVLGSAEPAADAVEVVLHGADGFARSLPLTKARDPETLLAWEVDGAPLPEVHGAPLRAVVPGWYGTDAVKWLTRIEVVREPFAGYWQAEEYRLAKPGDDGPGARMTAMPVHALVCAWDGGAVRGVAWGDGTPIARVEVRVDGGPWREADLVAGRDRWSLTRWSSPWSPDPGPHLIEVRATDAEGRTQPDRPLPNRGGFANHSVHRVQVRVG